MSRKGVSNVYRYKRGVLTEDCGNDGRVLSEDNLQAWTHYLNFYEVIYFIFKLQLSFMEEKRLARGFTVKEFLILVDLYNRISLRVAILKLSVSTTVFITQGNMQATCFD